MELGKSRERNRHSDHMRALALSIFSQCRRQLLHTNNVKSLTGFGTAAMADLFLKSKDVRRNKCFFFLFFLLIFVIIIVFRTKTAPPTNSTHRPTF